MQVSPEYWIEETGSLDGIISKPEWITAIQARLFLGDSHLVDYSDDPYLESRQERYHLSNPDANRNRAADRLVGCLHKPEMLDIECS